ncbi:GNAT family N-acetyltransferase [Actinopolymorpha sp. NPDC004070]|uniref:GNAT family N-acetyltransferase n=1 Tax=Actinopolymorpha sp. NPDC004070 TaxID=3154548 RepID=UPI0033B2C220
MTNDVNPHRASGSGPVTVGPIEDPARLPEAVDLYRAVLDLPSGDPAVSPRLLAGLVHNGGSVIGAYAGDTLVGFAYGYVGRDAGTGEVYHYSQAAVVDRAWQGRGVGRALKQGQREYVLATGLTRMRWAYDPVRARNAHFNLDVLGARGRWFVRDLYGPEARGPSHEGPAEPTDRLVVEWDLTGTPSPGAGPSPEPVAGRLPAWGEAVPAGDDLLLGVPRTWSRTEPEPGRAARVRAAVRDALEHALGQGYVAVSCRVPSSPAGEDVPHDTAYYRLRRDV